MPYPALTEQQFISINGDPFPMSTSHKRKIKAKEWQEEVKKQIKERKPERINGTCNLDIVFYLNERQYTDMNPYGPDIDNLLKPLLDGLKEELFTDDARITGMRAIKRCVAPGQAAGVDCKVIPTYDLTVDDVKECAGDKIKHGWRHQMQIISDAEGNQYIDNLPGQLFIDRKSKEPLIQKFSMINPGFDWRRHKGETVKGVMIFERRDTSYLWLNTWGDMRNLSRISFKK